MLESPQDPREKRRFYQALYSLSAEHGGDFDFIRQHFKAEARRLEAESRNTRDEVAYRWNQGVLQWLNSLEEMIHGARDTLEKLEANRII
ncbi:MAG: hypothetical protein KAV87_24235 [Desulfobacteraceae bacterium]|nr:hypothetical protein [Desulfobacteraceae bacterium]